MIYGYARVSTAAQCRDGNSLEEQVSALQSYGCQAIVEEAFSGKTTFTFTILDRKNRLYIIKGNNPLCLYYFEEGFYLYASTKVILDSALETMG